MSDSNIAHIAHDAQAAHVHPAFIRGVVPPRPREPTLYLIHRSLRYHPWLPQLPFEVWLIIQAFLDLATMFSTGVTAFHIPHISPLSAPFVSDAHVSLVLGPFDRPERAPECVTYLGTIYNILRVAIAGSPAALAAAVFKESDSTTIATGGPAALLCAANGAAVRSVIARAAAPFGPEMRAAVDRAARAMVNCFVEMLLRHHRGGGVPSGVPLGVPPAGSESLIQWYGRLTNMVASCEAIVGVARSRPSGLVVPTTWPAQPPIPLTSADHAKIVVMCHIVGGTVYSIDLTLMLPPQKMDVVLALLKFGRYHKARALVPQLGLLEIFVAAQEACGADDDLDLENVGRDDFDPEDDDQVGVICEGSHAANTFLFGVPWRRLLQLCDSDTLRAILDELAKSPLGLAGMRIATNQWFMWSVEQNLPCAATVLLDYFDEKYDTSYKLWRVLDDSVSEPHSTSTEYGDGNSGVGIEVMAALLEWAEVHDFDGIGGLISDGEDDEESNDLMWATFRDQLRPHVVRIASDPLWPLNTSVRVRKLVLNYFGMLGVDPAMLVPAANVATPTYVTADMIDYVNDLD